jgi:hypothetical protein
MVQHGFSLRSLFVATTLFALVTWAVASPSGASCIILVMSWSTAGAVWGWVRGSRRFSFAPVGCGAAGGATSVVAFIACYWPVFLCGYFFYEGEEEYFEDGFAVETFVYPVVYCMVYAPIGALVGSVVGSGVSLCGHLFVRGICRGQSRRRVLSLAIQRGTHCR